MTLKVNASDFSVILNICEGPDRDIFTIPSRCEVIRYFKVSKKISSCEDQVIHPHEIMPGVLFARSIFNPEKPFLRVMNLMLLRSRMPSLNPKICLITMCTR